MREYPALSFPRGGLVHVYLSATVLRVAMTVSERTMTAPSQDGMEEFISSSHVWLWNGVPTTEVTAALGCSTLTHCAASSEKREL